MIIMKRGRRSRPVLILHDLVTVHGEHGSRHEIRARSVHGSSDHEIAKRRIRTSRLTKGLKRLKSECLTQREVS